MSAPPPNVEGMDAWQPEPLPLWDDADDPWRPAEGSRGVLSEPVLLAPPTPRTPWAEAIGVFDLETTGVDVRHDRIVTAHVGVLGGSGEVVHSRAWLADPGVDIPAGATAVHGITTDHARTHGRRSADVIAEVIDELRALFHAGTPVVAYNAPYDFSLLKHEALRHGIDPILAPSPVIDPLVLDKAFDRYRRGKRTLSVVAAHYAVVLEGAHDASADAIAAGRVAQALATRFELPECAHELHTQQVGWARSQAESLTEYFVRIGRIDPADAVDGSWPIR